MSQGSGASREVVIVGGGVQGMMIGHDLAAHGHRVTVVEAAPRAGGLAGAMALPELDGLEVDRFYHCILSSDHHLRALLDELDLDDQLRFTTTQMAFFGADGGLHQMSTPGQFLTFPLLSLPARLRLGASIVHSNLLVRDASALESVPMADWLRRTAGDEVYRKLWGPLLRAKFDAEVDRLPASYMWARLKRMMSTRDPKSGVERMGHLIGGYQTLIDALASRLAAAGGQLHTRTRATALVRDAQGNLRGVRVEDAHGARTLEADATVLTLGNPRIKPLLADAPLPLAARQPLDDIGYMAIVCPLLVLDRPLSPYYTINLVHPELDMTGVIETTNIIDPALLGGRHLVYLPRYCSWSNPIMERDDASIMEDFLGQLQRVVPSFDRASILASRVMRARETEPVHQRADHRAMVPYAPGPQGVFIANSTQVYPDLVNCEAMTRNVRRALGVIHTALTPREETGRTALSRPLPPA